jgi:murein DD-endopeptidase MepM/ murein hydrolase activator NlpD
MRKFAALVLLTVLRPTAQAAATDDRLDWPLRPRPAVVRAFDGPELKWQRGHRGVDLAGKPGQTVYAAEAGTVVFAGSLAGRPLVSVAHAGGLRTSYEPVTAAVRPGALVEAGSVLGALLAGHERCPAPACLHWGAMWGPASRADYVDPLGLVAETPIRLKPLGGGTGADVREHT